MSFTLDEIIELCKEESIRHKKKVNQGLEEYFDNSSGDKPRSYAYVIGLNSGYYLAYKRLYDLLVDLREDNNEKAN